jgi:hypothetical protein
MKALAAEVTANFGRRLAPLGLVVKELTGVCAGWECCWRPVAAAAVRCLLPVAMHTAGTGVKEFTVGGGGRGRALLVVSD